MAAASFPEFAQWREQGIIASKGKVYELGAQVINGGTAHDEISSFIRAFNPTFSKDLSAHYPVADYYCSAADIGACLALITLI